MKVLLLNGSPHKEGTTFVALSEVTATLGEEGIETEIYHTGSGPVRGCTACMHCKQTNSGRCVFDDDPANTIIEKMETCDGLILGAPVHYAKPAGVLPTLCDRVFYAGGKYFTQKPGAAVTVARRGGNSASIDALNKYFQINGMPIVPSKYWPMVHGAGPDDAGKDMEGMQTMRMLGQNMSWLLKAIEAGKKMGIEPPIPEKPDQRTNFIR